MRGRRAGREEAVLEGGSAPSGGGHGPRTVTSGGEHRVALCADRDGFVMPRVTL